MHTLGYIENLISVKINKSLKIEKAFEMQLTLLSIHIE